FHPSGGGLPCGFGEDLGTIEKLAAVSPIVVVGTCVGNDGSFYVPRRDGSPPPDQYTTYYLRVEGYMKDATGRRAPFLKVRAPGGFLDGGVSGGGRIGAPRFLETGARHLLFLTPNFGFNLGAIPAPTQPRTCLIGR